MTTYLTDGLRLYEVDRYLVNYGLLGGYVARVRDCVSDRVREIGGLELALCRHVASR